MRRQIEFAHCGQSVPIRVAMTIHQTDWVKPSGCRTAQCSLLDHVIEIAVHCAIEARQRELVECNAASYGRPASNYATESL